MCTTSEPPLTLKRKFERQPIPGLLMQRERTPFDMNTGSSNADRFLASLRIKSKLSKRFCSFPSEPGHKVKGLLASPSQGLMFSQVIFPVVDFGANRCEQMQTSVSLMATPNKDHHSETTTSCPTKFIKVKTSGTIAQAQAEPKS